MSRPLGASGGAPPLDEIVREGARRMPAAAPEAEVDACVAESADERDESGRRLVVRNGYHQPGKVTTAAGSVEVRAPRVNDKRVDTVTGERRRFSSAILVPWCRKSPKITDDQDVPLEFYDHPAEHWIHLRTTNPIESTFATVRLRTKVTKGACSRAARLAMVFELVESAQARWRSVNGAHLVPLVRTGARFERGQPVERPETRAA
ncbi:hypothetical protein [Streptomyces sp. NPDC006551]|uniref:hypothetical protein n=1 Tax=Streptomyces sp. NPDC006551 TaxID=3157178 RepID=UPI0033AD2513